MNREEISRNHVDLWANLFERNWYCDEDNIPTEIALCARDAKAGNKRAQEYWARFIAELMK